MTEEKEIVSKEETFDKLEIRWGAGQYWHRISILRNASKFPCVKVRFPLFLFGCQFRPFYRSR